ncbi:MAG: hypothetical protein M2R45_04376 [Verrucomicrobia subdivision 3 bacterium]|nr:hypothetical protein [Limisphaerales bacterium]
MTIKDNEPFHMVGTSSIGICLRAVADHGKDINLIVTFRSVRRRRRQPEFVTEHNKASPELETTVTITSPGRLSFTEESICPHRVP